MTSRLNYQQTPLCLSIARQAGLCMLWAATLPAVAAEPGLLSEQEFYAELPVVLTASRLSQPLDEAPAAVTVIDRQMIEASGARNLADVFLLVPGFVVGYESGHRHVVSNHGLADQYSRRMQVLIDGRSVYLPSYGGVSWSDLPVALDDIERIEVIRGPNAATYGANAFLGIINISTRHSAADPGGFVRATIGSNDIRDGVLRAAGGSGSVSYRLTTAYQQDSGYGLRNDDRQITLFNGRIDGRASDADEIEYQFGYNDGPRGRGYPESLANYPHDQEITSRFQQLRWRHRLESGDEFAVQLYYNHHESDEQITTLPITVPFPPFSVQIPVNYDVKSERYDGEFQHTVGLGSGLRLVWGAGARLDSVEWPGFLGTSDAVENRHYRLFGNLEWRVAERLFVNAGAMYEKSEIGGKDVSPRLALNYQLVQDHTLRVGVSGATRQPVLFEERANARFCVNPSCTIFDQTFYSPGNLEPEHILASEIGYIGRIAPTVTLDARLFRDQVHKLIGMYTIPYPNIDGDARSFRNSDKATLSGTELQLDWRPERSSRVLFSYANVRIESSDVDALYSDSAPRNSMTLLALRDLGTGWQVSGMFHFQDKMAFIDGGGPIDTLWRVDLRLARRIRLSGASAEAALVLQNLIDPQPDYYPDSVPHTIGYFTFSLQTH